MNISPFDLDFTHIEQSDFHVIRVALIKTLPEHHLICTRMSTILLTTVKQIRLYLLFV